MPAKFFNEYGDPVANFEPIKDSVLFPLLKLDIESKIKEKTKHSYDAGDEIRKYAVLFRMKMNTENLPSILALLIKY